MTLLPPMTNTWQMSEPLEFIKKNEKKKKKITLQKSNFWLKKSAYNLSNIFML